MKFLYFLADWFPVLFMAAFTVGFIAICIMGGEISIKINGAWPTLKKFWEVVR